MPESAVVLQYWLGMSFVTSPTMNARLIPLNSARGMISCTLDEEHSSDSVALRPTVYR